MINYKEVTKLRESSILKIEEYIKQHGMPDESIFTLHPLLIVGYFLKFYSEGTENAVRNYAKINGISSRRVDEVITIIHILEKSEE